MLELLNVPLADEVGEDGREGREGRGRSWPFASSSRAQPSSS